MKYFKAAWRNLVYNRNYTVINIAGLGLAISACILIGLFVQNERSFDSHIPNVSQVYRLNEYIHYDGTAPQVSAATGAPIARFCKDNHNEIERYTRVFPATPYIYPSVTLAYEGKKIKTNNIGCTDTTFAGMFGVTISEGDKQDFVRDRNSIVLTQNLATRLFGTQSALHKTLRMITDDSTVRNVTVCNIIEELPASSHLQVEGLLPISDEFEKKFMGQSWGALLGPTYLRLRPGTDINTLQTRLTATLHSKNKFIDLQLQPVKKIHMASSDINYDYYNYNRVDGKYITVFMIIALAIFLIACCNFINLSIAIAAYRGKEIAVKKIMGAGRSHIFFQVLAETFIGVAGAVALSILLTAIFLPSMNDVVGRQIPVSNLYGWPVAGIYTAILLTTTLFAGLYPALLVSGSKINQALKSKVLFGGSRTSLRNVLVTGQFTIALFFIIGLTIFLRQLQFLGNKNLGYAYEQVMKAPLDVQGVSKLGILRSELLKIKGVSDISSGFMELGGKGSLFGIEYLAPDGQRKNISVNFENGAANYAGFFGMKILAGRDFTRDNPNNEYLINETLAHKIGYKDPVGKEINLASFPPGRVVGVVQDFNYSSLHSGIEPLLISSINYVPVWKSQLYIKVSTSGIMSTVKEVTARLKAVTGDNTLEPQFLDEHFKRTYDSERNAGTIIAIIGVLAISIACLGLFGLAAFVIVKRAKEISIRKVLGASVAGVVMTLSRAFIRLVVIAFAIATPMTWWLINKWLQGFAYRIKIQWWMFALAGAVAVMIAFLTVGVLAIRAARSNPMKSLRTE
ncbi:ABC transporter permease [Flavitalea sp. BT771]|uniref:ABC transporter permease n=1 Tax=Flavitalea sp. BT771 TaxID=3063329 RepID=UPI0026E36D07|nr:ABC transporter permease [Flavitalea sp. BT771]MDO6429338.1 ABC transporter permease [Flavitalea sp. BT771]MDV6218534.1 ABC transporter permease [Flavitalea sp. BT771]